VLGDPQLPAHADIAETLTRGFVAVVRHRPCCEWPRALSAKFTVSVAIAQAFFAQSFPVKTCLAQFPALSSIGVFITCRPWRSVISSWRRRRRSIVNGWRRRRTIRDGATDNSACGDAAKNARADGAADAVRICRCGSDQGSNANACSAD
jgi:hypothetical protein